MREAEIWQEVGRLCDHRPSAHALRYKFHANNESRKPDCYGNALKPSAITYDSLSRKINRTRKERPVLHSTFISR